jgi:dephospho-CoA kinase
MANIIVGLTGGIGSGKTTVSNLFANHGVSVIDADIVARDCVAPKSTALTAIVARFGSDILAADGSLDRAKLRAIVFADEQQKQWLNQLLHPLIRIELLAQLAAAPGHYVILSAALLIENELTSIVNRVLVIDVSEQTQISRTMARDHNPLSIVQSIMASQASRAQRLNAAHDIIQNEDCNLAELAQQVANLHHMYVNLG